MSSNFQLSRQADRHPCDAVELWTCTRRVTCHFVKPEQLHIWWIQRQFCTTQLTWEALCVILQCYYLFIYAIITQSEWISSMAKKNDQRWFHCNFPPVVKKEIFRTGNYTVYSIDFPMDANAVHLMQFICLIESKESGYRALKKLNCMLVSWNIPGLCCAAVASF